MTTISTLGDYQIGPWYNSIFLFLLSIHVLFDKHHNIHANQWHKDQSLHKEAKKIQIN